MRGRSVTITSRHERWIYAALSFVYVTGVAWMVLRYGVNSGRDPDDVWRVVESWTLAAHGAAAMAALIAGGSMLAVHVPTGWKLSLNIASGVMMLGLLGILALTGWLLYYASGEGIRTWSSYLHMVAGAAGPLGLLWHLAYRNRVRRTSRQSERQSRPSGPAPPTASVLPWSGRRDGPQEYRHREGKP